MTDKQQVERQRPKKIKAARMGGARGQGRNAARLWLAMNIALNIWMKVTAQCLAGDGGRGQGKVETDRTGTKRSADAAIVRVKLRVFYFFLISARTLAAKREKS